MRRVWFAGMALFGTASAWGTALENPRYADVVPPVDYRHIEVIEVRAQRFQSLTQPGLEEARLRLQERAGGTALVDAEDYRERRVSTLTDALGMTAGVFVQPRFGAEEARLSIRGSGLQRTFHMRGIKLLQDGVPLSLADGSGDFQAIEPLSARYIEVYRGANALEYGAATLGGAINFVSPTGHDASPLSLRVESGRFGYQRAQLAVAGVSGRHDGYLSATGFSQDGFRDHARQETYRLFGNYGYRFSEALDGRLYLTHVETRSELPGSLTREEFRADPRQAASGNVALDQRRDFSLTRLAGRLAWLVAPGQEVVASAYVADKSLDHPIFQVLRQDSLDYGLDLRLRSESTLGGHRNVLLAGVTVSRGETDDRRFVNSAGKPGAPTARSDQTASNVEAFAENQYYLTDHLALSAGLQFSHARREFDDRLRTGGIDRGFSRHYSGLSPKLGLRYQLNDAVQLFGNLSRSHEPPSFGELAGGPGITQVDAQKATTLELGARIEHQALSLDAALYRAWIEDELLSLTDGAGNPLGTVNADDTLHQGLELALGWRVLDQLTLSANYLWNDFRFDSDAVYGNRKLAGVPPHLLRAELRWQWRDWLYLSPGLEWSARDYYIDHANTLKAPGYTTVNLRLGGRVGEHWSWFVDARNLTDRDWIATTGVVADAGGVDGRFFMPGDGRAIYAGFEWRL